MAANDITFRPATRSDARVIAELFQISSEGVADYIWSQMQGEDYEGLDLIEIGTRRYEREDVDFSYQNCDVAEIDGAPIGMLHAYEMGSDVGNVPADCDPVLKPFMELEEPKSFYISGLAMLDEYRGQGAGTRLLDFAYKRARAEGLKKVSLICFAENKGAYKLYRREGFEDRDRRPIVPHPLIHLTGDAVLMVKST